MATNTPQSTPEKKSGANPIIAIALAITIALLLSGIGLVVFLNSDTRETVRLIQQQTDNEFDSGSSDEGNLDTTSMPTVEDIETIKSDIESLRQSLPAVTNPEEFGDQSLGL